MTWTDPQPQPQPQPLSGVGSISPTVHIDVDKTFSASHVRLVDECKKDGMIAVFARRLDVAPTAQCLTWRHGMQHWKALIAECVATHYVVQTLLSPTVIHIGTAVVVVQTDESRCWDLAMVYQKGHPISKSVRRMHRRTLNVLRKDGGAAPPTPASET